MPQRPTAIDLFAGAGGLSLGLEQAGFDIVAAVEIDPIHAAIHSYNFPETRVLCADITEVSGRDLVEAAALQIQGVDLVAGGPPCQGFSLIGKRVLDDPRNALVREFVRIVAEIRPRAFLFENVPGLAVGKHEKFLHELVAEFRGLGYRMPEQWQVLDAADFGVPQHRRRLFLIGTLDGLVQYPSPRTTPADAKTAHTSSVFLPQGPTVRDAIGDLPEVEAFPELMGRDWLAVDLPVPTSEYAAILRGLQRRAGDFSYKRLSDGKRLTGLKRAAHTDLSRQRFTATPPGATEPVSRFKKLAWDGLCNTLRAGTARNRGAFTSPRPIHPEAARCITIREAARLHSYPDWFSFHSTVWHGFRQIGNSVPPLLAEAVGSALADALGARQIRPRRAVRVDAEWLRYVTMTDAAALFDVSADVIPHRVRGAEVQSDAG